MREEDLTAGLGMEVEEAEGPRAVDDFPPGEKVAFGFGPGVLAGLLRWCVARRQSRVRQHGQHPNSNFYTAICTS